jgi:hypothetical protein
MMLFLLVGAVSAVDSLNVQNTEDSNLIEDNDDSLSENKLEISSEVSISQTNIVNSHDDNLGNYPNDNALKSNYSGYEDNNQEQLASSDVEEAGESTVGSISSSAVSVVADSPSNDVVSAGSSAESSIKSAAPASTKLSVSDTHYAKSATQFEVALKDKDGKALSNQKVTLKVKSKTYSAYTNAKGIAYIKTASLAVGTYAVSLSYAGNSNYSSSSLSKKVRVLSSISASDLTKYCGHSSAYKATFWKGTSALKNAKVTFKINGKSYTKTTNGKGVATLNIKLHAGKFTITMSNPNSKESVSHKVVVKKDKTSLNAKGKTYIFTKSKGSFSVTLKTKHNALLKNKKITFTFNNKTVTGKTNKDGKATITIPVLSKGTHKISYKYEGSDNYYSSSGSAKLVVHNPTTKVSASDVVMNYGGSTKFKVTLKTSEGKALANKNIKLNINGKTLKSKTDKRGKASFSLKEIPGGTFKATYHYSEKGSKDYSHGSNKVTIHKLPSKISASDVVMKANDGSVYKLKVKDKSGKALKGVFVKSVVHGRTFFYQTNDDGEAKLKITLGVGYYTVKSTVVDPGYTSSTISKHIQVKGYRFVAKNVYVSVGDKASYSVKVLDEKKKPVKKGEVTFTFNGKTLTSKTDSKGLAKVSLGVLSKGTHKIKYSIDSSSGSSKIYAVSKVSIKDIVDASKTVKKYISKHSRLPSSVKVGDVSFKTADYLYIASKAIVNLKKGNTKDISIKILKNPSKPKDATNLGYLNNYLSAAEKVVKTADSKGKLPNSVGSKIGTIGYKGLVSAFSKVLTSYGKNKKMPKYVSVKAFSGSPSPSTGVLNSKNTIKNLAAYLAASKNCEVNDAQIKKLVTKLTKNCKTEKQKAEKIFNYVRDTLSYSFYYNTKYGAAGTLKNKAGNCVDHAHLTVAMLRCAGLPTRYVHATCHFNSGHTFGHVWAQVLIGNTWTVADTTSSRNSLGKVGNWNTHSYKLQGYHSSISF